MKKRTRSARRLLLGGLCLAALASPMLAAGGCGSAFDSISKINGLRVLTVIPAVLDEEHPTLGTEVTGSYANPGDEVTFSMVEYDGLVDPKNPDAPERPLQILWLAGCYDPPNDAYYGCYSQLADV